MKFVSENRERERERERAKKNLTGKSNSQQKPIIFNRLKYSKNSFFLTHQ